MVIFNSYVKSSIKDLAAKKTYVLKPFQVWTPTSLASAMAAPFGASRGLSAHRVPRWTLRTEWEKLCLLVVKHGNGKSPINGNQIRKITYKWSIFHCHIWLPEGRLQMIRMRPGFEFLCSRFTGVGSPIETVFGGKFQPPSSSQGSGGLQGLHLRQDGANFCGRMFLGAPLGDWWRDFRDEGCQNSFQHERFVCQDLGFFLMPNLCSFHLEHGT